MTAAGTAADVEAARVAHLVELGYEDPLEAEARRARLARAHESQLKVAEQLAASGQSAAAVEALERLLEEAPEWPAPRRLLAKVHYAAGRVADALTQLQWLEVHGVEHAELSLMRAAIHLQRRELPTALEQAEYARSLQQPLPAADAVIGEAHLRRGDLSAADIAFGRAIEQNSSCASAHAGLAAVRLRRGEFEAGADAALQALESDPRLATAHYRLGLALAGLGRSAEATVALESAAALNPRCAAPFRRLAQLAVAAGESEKATEYRRRGREVIKRRTTKTRRHEEISDLGNAPIVVLPGI